MREIKFKAKRKDNKEWVYGYVFKDLNGTCQMLYNNDNGDIEFIDIIPETICEYTGQPDINGVEIYENDIVEEGCNGFVSSVIWDNEVGTYKLKDLGDYYIKDATIEWEVIGNIYDKEVK